MTAESRTLNTGQDFIEVCRRRKLELGPRRNQESVPMLPVDLPSLPAGWSWTGFSELCERVSVGHVGPTSDFFCTKGHGVPLLRSQDVRPGKLHLDGVAYVTEEFHQSLKKSKLKSGDILIVRVGANRGDCCVVPDGVGELNCANIVFARPLYPNGFFGFYFRSELGQGLLLSATTGSAQGVINTGSVAQMPVPVPPLSIQERIASILSAYDDLIENNTRRIKILEEMAQMLYREWFVNFRFPGHEKVQMVDSEMGPIPKGWSAKKLGDVLQLEYGKALKAEDRAGGNVPVYGSSGVVGYHGQNLANGPGIVVGRKGNVGSVFLCPSDFWVIDTAYYVRTSLPLHFVFFNLQSQNFLNNDAAVPGLNRKQALSLPVLVPDPLHLQEFGRIVGPMFELKFCLERRNTNLRATRDLLLPKLISGEVSVENIEVEAMV